MATPGAALESDISHRVDAMSTAMPRAPLPIVAIILAMLLGACAPTHEWAAPGIGQSMRDGDLRDCTASGARAAADSYWFERRRAERESWWARRPSDRAFANMRLQQAQMFEMRDRQRHVEACMGARGYRLVPVDPEP
jgi:hypothetical protein